MKEFLYQWWPLFVYILLGIITVILDSIVRKKDVAISLGRHPDDPEEIADRWEYKGKRYVELWPSGGWVTEEFYNRMRKNNKEK